MRLEKNVSLKMLAPQIVLALLIADDIFKKVTGEEVRVTCLFGGKHSAIASLHYIAHAVDLGLGTKGFDNYVDSKYHRELVAELGKALCDEFDVVYERNHIHVEWQPKR